MYKRLFKLIIIFGAAAAAPPVHAQTATVCMERTQLIEQLEMRYHEAPAGIGLSSPSHLVEIWSSDESGSFTIFVTRPDGISCFLATGEAWQGIAVEPEKGMPS